MLGQIGSEKREEKRREEEKEKEKEEEEEEIKVWNLLETFVRILYGFWYEFLYGYLLRGL